MKHMSLELEMLEKRIAPGLPIVGCTILCGGHPPPGGGPGGSSDGGSQDSGDHDKSSGSAGSSGSHSSGHSS